MNREEIKKVLAFLSRIDNKINADAPRNSVLKIIRCEYSRYRKKLNQFKSTDVRVRELLTDKGWVELPMKSTQMKFVWQEVVMSVWPTTMTVATKLIHPRKGKTTLYRKDVSLRLLEWLAVNPRKHTRKGYLLLESKS